MPITISPVDVVPTNIQGNPTINTLNNKYTGLTMLFSEGGVDAGVVTTSSSQSSISNVSFSNGTCTFDYTTPTTDTSDTIIFTSCKAADIQYVNASPHFFEITNLLNEPNFSNWLYTPASQNFSYTNSDSLVAVFNKDIKTCTSITASSGSPLNIVPISIIGKQIRFEWASLSTGSVNFTFNGLESLDGSIDANVNGLIAVGPILLNTPPIIVGWTGSQPTEENTLYNLSVLFNKELSNSRIPIITATDGITPVFTSISGSQVNFTVTTSSTPSTTVYSLKNIAALDGSIKSASLNISAGAKIISVQVETDLYGSYLEMSSLVIERAQKVKIILSKPISGVLSFVPNENCEFGVVTMINSSTAQLTITPVNNGSTSLVIQTNNIITVDGSQSVLSRTFSLVYSQTILNLYESSNKNVVKTTFDVETLVSLSLQVSKPISSDLSETTITCSNGTVSNVSTSTIGEKYYYNFDFTPTLETTNQTITVNRAKDLSNFKYTISYGGLTFINPYIFATGFNFLSTSNNRYYGQGYLSQGISSSLILTFTGGDNLHSDVVTTQISYVKYTQDNVETTISPSLLSCSKTLNTITINNITPLTSNALIIKVQLKSPKGMLGAEITNTLTPDKFANPITAVNVTSLSIPSPYKLVVNNSVNLTFNFSATTSFTSTIISSFSAIVNGNPLSLAFATASGISLTVPYTAISVVDHNFVFFGFNQQFNFVILSNEVYLYPTIINTTRNIPTVSLGKSLTISSNFLAGLPLSMTANVTVTPFNNTPETYIASISSGSLVDVTTPTWYYPFSSNIQNYASGVGVTDATIGVGGNTTGGISTFEDGGLVLTGSTTHNAAGASYIVLPITSSGNTAAFSCWFKSNNNPSYTRIIDMATNGTFRLYVTGSNSLNFNDVYTFSTATPINNNTWNFIAINTTATTLSWVLNAGDTGNYGSGSIISKPVNFNASVGYLGHSFGSDPEFAGLFKKVSFYSNANLTTMQINSLYMGTTRISIIYPVTYDVNHSGSVRLSYGTTSNTYTWGSDTLTSSNIYTFPSSFTFDGTSNGYYGGAHLKAATSGTLVLTFSGGDMLFSSVIASQVSYVKYTQGQNQTTVTGAVCSDPLDTVTFIVTPAVKEDLTLQVKLIGPDGTIGSELTNTVSVSQFETTSDVHFSYLPTVAYNSPSTVLNVGNLGNVTSTYTIEFWFRVSSFGQYTNVCDMNYSTYPGVGNCGPRLELPYWVWSNSTTSSGPLQVASLGAISTNVWYYTAFTMNNGTVNVYVNSNRTDTNIPSTAGYLTTFGSVVLGTGFQLDTNRYFHGSIANFKIYRKALSASECLQNFNSTLWDPSRITTALWLDASDSTTLTTVSGSISEWRDKSGNSRNAVQSTDNYRPSTSTLNNLTILTFDGINDNMNIPTTILQSQSKPNIFYVFVPNNNNSNNAYSPEITFNSTNNGDNGSFHYVKSNLLGASYPMYTAGGWGNYENAGSGYVYGSAEMISFITLTSTYNVYRNGILEGSSYAGNVLSYSTGLQLAQQQGSRTSGISFAEIVLVFGDSNDTYQRIEGYLAWKWGLVSKLPTTHPYKSAKP
jgi:hypothetical protein